MQPAAKMQPSARRKVPSANNQVSAFRRRTSLAKLALIVFLPSRQIVGCRHRLLVQMPAPKLTVTGRLDPTKATAGEIAGEKLFFGKAQCSTCHPAPVYLDNQMHDLHVERFLKNEAGDGPINAFTLRGIKDSPRYLHDGRALTLEDTVEFFNLVLELKLTPEEKHNLVEFMRQL
jgi:hypothetical protein